MSDLSHKDTRRQIATRFFQVYGDWTDVKIADELSQNGPRTTSRTIARARRGETVPNTDLASAMDRKLDVALMSDEDRYAHFESERARREAIQREATAFITDEGIRTDYPEWVDKAFARYRARQFDVMLEVMSGRVGKNGESDLSSNHLPFVLNLEGSGFLETGLYRTAIDRFDQVLALAGNQADFDHLRTATQTNLAIAYMLQGQFDTAIDHIETTLKSKPGHAPAYYNAICIQALRGDAAALTLWLGRAQTAAQEHFTLEGLTEFMSRTMYDPDIKFAREQPIWAEFERWMLALKASMQKQLSGKDAEKELT